ncbi:MAG: M48 family metallopeptidase [Chromatiales bacterium]|nr:M48 family metallopeptidase [Chromatiales bacterium]
MNYRVRISSRAKNVRLMISRAGLEVVIPRGFDPDNVPSIVDRHRAWIDRHLKKRRDTSPLPPVDNALPDRIELAAVGKAWTIEYQDRSGDSVWIEEFAGSHVKVWGNLSNPATSRELLRKWLLRTAKKIFAPWLKALSAETGLDYARLQVRTQKSRWGSCSSSGTISLNAKLLFMPPELVRHVMIHELCHTVHPNHSHSFWALVARHDPDYRSLKRRLNEAGKAIPRWVTYR